MKYTNNEISPPAAKTLAVLECFAFASGELSLKEISEHTGISQATLLRILNTLLEYGYITRSSDKKYQSCFTLHKAGSISAKLEPYLKESLKNLVATTEQSAEILTVKENCLFWHNKKESPDLQIQIKAQQGHKRRIYELDAPSRLYLKYLGAEKVAENFGKDKFFDTLYKNCSWKEAVKIWEKEKVDDITLDLDGNGNGVRRYATLICDKHQNFLFILSVAEAATPYNNTEEHINKVISAIKTEKKALTKIINSI